MKIHNQGIISLRLVISHFQEAKTISSFEVNCIKPIERGDGRNDK